jgi:hypothetical protein
MNPKECKCPKKASPYHKFKSELRTKLAACTHLDPGLVKEALADWERHFETWDDLEGHFSNCEKPDFKLPSPSNSKADAGAEASRKQGDADEEQAALRCLQEVQVSHEGNKRGARQKEVNRNKSIRKSNAGGFRAGVPNIKAGCMVVLQADVAAYVANEKAKEAAAAAGRKKKKKKKKKTKAAASLHVTPPPFYIAELVEATQPKKGGDFGIKIRWWDTTGRTDKRYKGPVGSGSKGHEGRAGHDEQGGRVWSGAIWGWS